MAWEKKFPRPLKNSSQIILSPKKIIIMDSISTHIKCIISHNPWDSQPIEALAQDLPAQDHPQALVEAHPSVVGEDLVEEEVEAAAARGRFVVNFAIFS